ncbi:MAG: hypothetical protein ACLUXK_03625 [[Ruminococcus] torques]
MLKGVTDIQTALINMLEIALLEKCNDNAEFFADMYKTITRQFCFQSGCVTMPICLLAIDKKNKDECLSILKKMLPAMKKSGMYRIVSYTAMQKIVNLRFFK